MICIAFFHGDEFDPLEITNYFVLDDISNFKLKQLFKGKFLDLIFYPVVYFPVETASANNVHLWCTLLFLTCPLGVH